MSAFSLLQQLLGKNAGILSSGQEKAKSIFNEVRQATTGQTSVLESNDKTRLVAGALAVLFGSKIDSELVKLGGWGAIGLTAYQVYQRWQAQKQGGATTPTAEPLALGYTQNEQENEVMSKALLVAMITAAKADGHIQEEEKQQLDAQLAQITDPQDKAWFQQELNKPVDPAYVASFAANNMPLSAQVYAVSLAICNEQNFMEKAYLEELAKQLQLDPQLKTELENQVHSAS